MSSLGKALLPAKTTCHVRPIRLVPLSSNYESLLHAPGAALSRDYEFVQEGFRFEDRDNIEVLLYQVLRVPAPGALAQSAAIRGNRWLCEVRSICNDDQLHAQQAKVNAYAKALEQSEKKNRHIQFGQERLCGTGLARGRSRGALCHLRSWALSF